MSKYSEFIKLFPKGLANINEIVDGIINDVKMDNSLLDESVKDKIIQRRLLCEVCPFMSKNAVSSEEYKEVFGKNYETKRDDNHCSLCGCKIKLKTASLNSQCAINDNKEVLSKGFAKRW